MNVRSYPVMHHAAFSIIILVAAITVFYAIIVMPAVHARGKFSEKMDNLQFQYLKYSRVENQKDDITKQLQQLKRVKTSTEGFLKENSPALAAAELQEYIMNLVESNNGSLISTQVVNRETKEAFPQVTVKVQLRCGMESLRGIIYQVESGDPVLLLDNLYIQNRNGRSSRIVTRRNTQQQSEPLFEVRFDVNGFVFQAESA